MYTTTLTTAAQDAATSTQEAAAVLERLRASASQADIADPPQRVNRAQRRMNNAIAKSRRKHKPARMTKAQMVAWCQASASAIKAGAVDAWPEGLNQRRAMRILGIDTVLVGRTTGNRAVPADAWAEARRATQAPEADTQASIGALLAATARPR